jgi:hypothetical protein
MEEPCPSIGPVPFGSGDGDPQRFRRLFECQASEIAELHEFGLSRIVPGQLIQRFIDREQFPGIRDRRDDFDVANITMFRPGTVFHAALAPRALHKDPPHRLRGGSEKVRAVVEIAIAQPQPGFVDKGGGLQRVTGRLALHFRARDLPQFPVNGLHEFVAGVRHALAHGLKHSCDISRRWLVHCIHFVSIIGLCGVTATLLPPQRHRDPPPRDGGSLTGAGFPREA